MTGKYVWDKIEPLNLQMVEELVEIKQICEQYADTDIPRDKLRRVKELIDKVITRIDKRLENL